MVKEPSSLQPALLPISQIELPRRQVNLASSHDHLQSALLSALSACFARGQCRFRRSPLILQPLALFLLPTLCNSILLVVDSSRQCNDVIVASGSAGTLSEYELWSLQRASHSSTSR